MPRLWSQSPTHCLRDQRDELLSALPDWGQTAGRQIAVETAQERLAQDDRSMGRIPVVLRYAIEKKKAEFNVHTKTVLVIGIWFVASMARVLCVAGEPADKPVSVATRRQRVAIMVHRGSLDLAVENTLAAIEASFLTGADGVEIDIAQTSDGVLVLMHDPWVDRVLDGFGNVADLTYGELLAMSFRDPYGVTRANEHVPTLRDSLELIDRYNGLIHLDIKVPGIDQQVHDLLAELNLLQNVVTVNDYNSERVLADSRIAVLPSQGSLIHGNNDYDAEAVGEHLARRPIGTFLVDDARCAAALLGRQSPKHIREVVVSKIQRKKRKSPAALLAESSPVGLIGQLQRFQPVQSFDTSDNRPDKLAAVIRSRAAIAKAMRGLSDTDQRVCTELETMIKQRSLHTDGAWQGLDGSQAVQVLAHTRPNARTVDILKQVVQRIDPQLKEVESRDELPWWLRQSGAWWDFRIKTESLAALGRIGGPEAREALWQLLETPTADARASWRELHWDAARALTSGSWQLAPAELERLLVHDSSGARRAGCVYLTRFRNKNAYRDLLRKHLPWLTMKSPTERP